MSHSIKVTDKVYATIMKYMGPQESFSSVIERALSVFEEISAIKETLGPAHYLIGKQKEEAK